MDFASACLFVNFFIFPMV